MFGEEEYTVLPTSVTLSISKTNRGHVVHLRGTVSVQGACMRCLEHAAVQVDLDTFEVHEDREGEEFSSPYIENDILDADQLVRDTVSITLPYTIVCEEECAGLCAECGKNLNHHRHSHPRTVHSQWTKLRELQFD